MRARELVTGCLVILMVGCQPIVSLHPLATQETIVFEEKLLGTWVNDANDPEVTWEFARLEAALPPEAAPDEPPKGYHLRLVDKEGHKGSFVTVLVKLENRLFLDVFPFPDMLPSGEQDIKKTPLAYNTLVLLPVHTFIRVAITGERLQLGLTIDKQFNELLQAEPNAVRHEMIDDRPVLTASTKQLQAFVLKYADDERLFLGDATLVRKSQ